MGRWIDAKALKDVAFRQQIGRVEDKITGMRTVSPPAGVFATDRSSLDPRRLSVLDLLLDGLGQALASNHNTPVARRPAPTAGRPDVEDGSVESVDPVPLTDVERRHSAGLMRVNHVGEVCAQALYQGQAAGAQDARLRDFFVTSGQEEADHLAWTRQRLDELQARPSVLNPLWYAGAYALGLLAARAGDARSLGFTVETERQVEAHLAGHLDRLPASDADSRAIVAAMKDDEAAHAAAARRLGAAELPAPLKWTMRLAARVMTTTAYRV
jgi:ubiquinone biosynthesis monooxygenase Coq7